MQVGDGIVTYGVAKLYDDDRLSLVADGDYRETPLGRGNISIEGVPDGFYSVACRVGAEQFSIKDTRVTVDSLRTWRTRFDIEGNCQFDNLWYCGNDSIHINLNTNRRFGVLLRGYTYTDRLWVQSGNSDVHVVDRYNPSKHHISEYYYVFVNKDKYFACSDDEILLRASEKNDKGTVFSIICVKDTMKEFKDFLNFMGIRQRECIDDMVIEFRLDGTIASKGTNCKTEYYK